MNFTRLHNLRRGSLKSLTKAEQEKEQGNRKRTFEGNYVNLYYINPRLCFPFRPFGFFFLRPESDVADTVHVKDGTSLRGEGRRPTGVW